MKYLTLKLKTKKFLTNTPAEPLDISRRNLLFNHQIPKAHRVSFQVVTCASVCSSSASATAFTVLAAATFALQGSAVAAEYLALWSYAISQLGFVHGCCRL